MGIYQIFNKITQTRKIIRISIYSVVAVFLFFGTASAQNSPLAVEGSQTPFGNHKVLHQFGNVIFADQPDKATVEMYKDKDVKMVISIRGESENAGFDERKAVEKAGMAFIQIPYMKGRKIDGQNVDEILSLLNMTEENGSKVVLHCTHSQRAGSLLGVALYKKGYSREEANKLAKEAGMTSEMITKIHNQFLDTLR